MSVAACLAASPAQRKWDLVYEQKDLDESAYPGVLADAAHLLPARGRALDLACGAGAAAVHLARRGFDVTAWDISPVAIAKLARHAAQHGLAIATEVVDIPHAHIPRDAFDVIVVSRYLERGVCASLSQALRPGGLLAYQTFSIEAPRSPTHMNPGFCLTRGELLRLFHDLRPVFYREDALVGDTSRGLRNEVRLIAQRCPPLPAFFTDWVRRACEGDDPAALSRAIARYRKRLANLGDELEPAEPMASATDRDDGEPIEMADAVVMRGRQSPTVRALVVPKGHFVMPTDLAEDGLHRLGRIVDAVAESFRLLTGTRSCRSYIPHPADCRSRRMHVVVDSEVQVSDKNARRMLWRAVAEHLRETLQTCRL